MHDLTIIQQTFLKSSGDQYLDFLAQREKIERILLLKEQKNVLVLGHNYMAPLVYNLSGEGERGDSLQLAQYAAKSDKPIILFDGVRFMAETAKILNSEKKVLIADMQAGCSLADPFRGAEVRAYKEQFPGLPIVIYINSYADAKAEADYCCTSSNGLQVVQHAAKEFGTERVIFLPDSLMGENLQDELREAGSALELIYPGKYDAQHGSCEVHEKISLEMVQNIRVQYQLPKHQPGETNPETAVLVHWECLPEVRKEADFCGSTSHMIRYVREHPSLQRVYLGTECEMAANLQNEFPQIDFVRTCAIACQHMAKITLDKIVQCLEAEQPEVLVPEEIRIRALKPIARMLQIK
ncbi:MAG TPA: quinolinate synthase [Candidatus Nanoarchaeia archaeon]|nr:quinolinate synthase [Candidatus Nanoarchaeia archaeon]